MILTNDYFYKVEYKFVITLISFLLYCTPQTVVVAAEPIPVKQIKYLFSIKGNKANPLSLPSDVSVDLNGNIYIVDSGNHRIAVFDDSGNNITYFSSMGNNKTQISNPVGIDVSGQNVYVADKDNHRIQVFNIDGGYIKSLTLRQGKKLIRPVDVAVNRKFKLLYVTGNNNHELMVYDLSGRLIRQWGGEGTNRGEFRYPATIASYNDLIYVVDVLNSRVQIFDNMGELQAIAGQWGVLPGQLFRPKGITHDKKGNIYISDSYLGVIQVFKNDTYFRYVLGDKGKPYRFKTPSGIYVDNNNRLYVCEMLANKVSVYSLEP